MPGQVLSLLTKYAFGQKFDPSHASTCSKIRRVSDLAAGDTTVGLGRIIAAVLVQIADLERRDLGAPQAHLQPDRQDRPVAQSGDGIFGRQVEQFARLRLREGEGRAFVAIDRRPLDLADRVARGVVVPDEMLIEATTAPRGAGGSSPARRAPLAFSARITSQPAAFSAVR
jgi:hypothetical protein